MLVVGVKPQSDREAIVSMTGTGMIEKLGWGEAINSCWAKKETVKLNQIKKIVNENEHASAGLVSFVLFHTSHFVLILQCLIPFFRHTNWILWENGKWCLRKWKNKFFDMKRNYRKNLHTIWLDVGCGDGGRYGVRIETRESHI